MVLPVAIAHQKVVAQEPAVTFGFQPGGVGQVQVFDLFYLFTAQVDFLIGGFVNFEVFVLKNRIGIDAPLVGFTQEFFKACQGNSYSKILSLPNISLMFSACWAWASLLSPFVTASFNTSTTSLLLV